VGNTSAGVTSATGSGKTETYLLHVLRMVDEAHTYSPRDLRRSIALLDRHDSWLDDGRLWVPMTASPEPRVSAHLLTPLIIGDIAEGPDSPTESLSCPTWNPVATLSGMPPLALALKDPEANDCGMWVLCSPGQPPPGALMAELAPPADTSVVLRRLMNGIRAVLCLVLMLASRAASRRLNTPSFVLVLLAASRRYGHRSEPDGRAFLPSRMFQS
jgi:hypothetical protein